MLTTCLVQIGLNVKSTQNLMKFGTFDILNMPISILMKFGTFDILNMPISILVSKMIFIKYLPPFRPKLVQKLKIPRIY